MQALDARADQLRHQRAHLPELAEINTLKAERVTVDNQVRDARIVVDDLTVEQDKIESDVEQVRTRRTRDQDRMDQGLISNPKDLERMTHELASLERRIGTLEDEELEVMARLEDAQRELDTHTAKITVIDERIALLSGAVGEKTADFDAQLVDVEAQRGPSVEGLPEDLLALYEKLRISKGGVGAAELRQRRCTGCQLGIDAAELSKIRTSPADLVIRCEECSRILVRTGESGI